MADERTSDERDYERETTEEPATATDESERSASTGHGQEYEEPAPELGSLHEDYSIPGVDESEPDPYVWHTGEKRDHGGEDAIEIIDVVK